MQYADKVIDRAVDGYIRTLLDGSGPYIIYHIEKAMQFEVFFRYGPSWRHINLKEFASRALPANLHF